MRIKKGLKTENTPTWRNQDGGCINSVAPKQASLLQSNKLTIRDAAKAMGIGVTSLRRLIKEGGLPVLRVEGKILILERDVELYLQDHYAPIAVVKYENKKPVLPVSVQESDVWTKV